MDNLKNISSTMRNYANSLTENISGKLQTDLKLVGDALRPLAEKVVDAAQTDLRLVGGALQPYAENLAATVGQKTKEIGTKLLGRVQPYSKKIALGATAVVGAALFARAMYYNQKTQPQIVKPKVEPQKTPIECDEQKLKLLKDYAEQTATTVIEAKQRILMECNEQMLRTTLKETDLVEQFNIVINNLDSAAVEKLLPLIPGKYLAALGMYVKLGFNDAVARILTTAIEQQDKIMNKDLPKTDNLSIKTLLENYAHQFMNLNSTEEGFIADLQATPLNAEQRTAALWKAATEGWKTAVDEVLKADKNSTDKILPADLLNVYNSARETEIGRKVLEYHDIHYYTLMNALKEAFAR